MHEFMLVKGNMETVIALSPFQPSKYTIISSTQHPTVCIHKYWNDTFRPKFICTHHTDLAVPVSQFSVALKSQYAVGYGFYIHRVEIQSSLPDKFLDRR